MTEQAPVTRAQEVDGPKTDPGWQEVWCETPDDWRGWKGDIVSVHPEKKLIRTNVGGMVRTRDFTLGDTRDAALRALVQQWRESHEDKELQGHHGFFHAGLHHAADALATLLGDTP